MAWKFCLVFNCLLLALVFFFSGLFAAAISSGQEKEKSEKAYQSAQDLAESPESLKKEIARGVSVIGKAHRFAELGDCDSFSLSPDGKTLACSGSSIKLFDLEEDKIRETIGEEGEFYQGVEFSDDGRYLVGHTYKNTGSLIRVWDALDFSLINSYASNEGVVSETGRSSLYIQQFKVSPENNYVAASDYNTLVVRDLKTGELVHHIKDLNWSVQSIAFSPDERQLFVPKSGRIQVFDLDSGEAVSPSDSSLAREVATIMDVNASQNLAAVANGRSIRILDLKQSSPSRTLTVPQGLYVQKVKFSDDGKQIAAAVWQAGETYHIGVAIVDVESGKLIRHKKKTGAASHSLGTMQFSTDNRTVFYAGSGIHGINEFDLTEAESDSEDKFPKSPANSIVIHPDSQSFAACTSAGDVNSFEFESGEIVKSFGFASPASIQLARDGTSLLVKSRFGQTPFQSFNYDTGKSHRKYQLKTRGSVFSYLSDFMRSGSVNAIHSQSYPISVAMSEDGQQVNVVAMQITYRPIGGSLTGEFDQRYLIQFASMDAENGRPIHRRRFQNTHFGLGEDEWAHMGAVSHDGTKVAVGKADLLTVVETSSGKKIYEIESGEREHLRSAKFSPADRFLVSTMTKSIVVRDAETGETVAELAPENRQGTIISGFSGDGKRFVVCDSAKDGQVQVYSTDSWEPVFERDGTQFKRTSVSVSNDGQLIVIGLADCRLEIWDRSKLN